MATEPVRGSEATAGLLDMEQISQNIQLLPEATLEQIAKGPLVKFTHTCEDVEKSTRVFQSLFLAFSSASISHSHTTAACNALSAFLDAAFVSQCPETRQLARSQENLVSVFDSFLTRFKDVRPRPMKQVLESLAVIMAKSREEPGRDAIQQAFLNAALPSIILGEPRNRVKPSFIAVETLLRKKAILPTEMISLVEGWLLRNPERWPIVLQEECRNSWVDVSGLLRQPAEQAASDLQSRVTAVEILILGFLNRSKALDLASSSGEVMAMFFKKLEMPGGSLLSNGDKERLALSWVKPVKHFLLQNLELLEKMSNYILLRLFGISAKGFQRFLERLPLNSLLSGDMSSSSSDELTVLFASLQVGKKIGLVHDDFYFTKLPTENCPLILKSEFVGQFLFHHDFNIKMAALSLLITAPSTTKPLSSAAVRAITKSLPSLHAESDPGTRGEILSMVRALIIRLKGGILANVENPVEPRTTQSKKQPIVFKRDDAETRSCLEVYLNFLMADLRTTASYHRHIMSLRTIYQFLESGLDERFIGAMSSKPEHLQNPWKFHVEIFGPKLLRLLVDLLMDPFDEVRTAALSLLKIFPRSVLLDTAGRSEKPELLNAITKAETLASNTSRADHADTVALLYSVVFSTADAKDPQGTGWWKTKIGVVEFILRKLEDKLSSSESLFNSSLRDAPLHGYLSSLRYIVSSENFWSLVSFESSPGPENWKSVHTRISSLCDRIWQEVKSQLCIDSPEGHAADPIEDLRVGPKDILSYSWRALRESSLLLHATLSNQTYGPKGEAGLTRAEYEKIGRTSFTQLAELRHRGAFSTVASTFSICCQRCGQSKNAEISALPLLWYQEAKKIIFETASKLTRRSAGLPALIGGILLSNPGGPAFQQIISELQEVAHLPAQLEAENQNVELPQVHAMNCLREAFTNARLAPHAEGFLMPALNLSAERMGSPIWALRNAGLMLFRALMNRMCRNDYQGFGGKSGSEPGARIPFQKYPGLVPLLSNLLAPPQKGDEAENADTAMVTERVFPALELIAEKVPNAADADTDAMLLKLIREHLKSPVWGIREHAARVYASLLVRESIVQDIQTLLDKRDSESQNYLHGESLCIRYSLRRLAFTPSAFWNERIEGVKSTVQSVFAASYSSASSPFVQTTLLEMLSDAVERSIESGAEGELVDLLDFIFNTYQVPDTVDFVFDSSNPSFTTLSTTRAFSLLRRQLAWITILKSLTKGDTANFETFVHNVATIDPNACQWVLERLHGLFKDNEKYSEQLVKLYTSIIIGGLPLEVRTPAISNLASYLQTALESIDTALETVALPWTDLAAQVRIGSTKQGFNRDRVDADLQLEGCLIGSKSLSSNNQISETEIQEWATRLRSALSEETEFTTRYAAATSISAFARTYRPHRTPPRVDATFLEIYLILYDLLNDDDEELRDIAASTASWILSYSSVSPSKAVTLSPINASELFATFLADNYTQSQLLSTRAIRYILGLEPRIGDSSRSSESETTLMPVSYITSELRKESTILFEEEKQNLFIEAVREVDLWCEALTRLAVLDEQLLKDVFSWVSDGLTCFSDILARPDGEDGLVGWIAKPEAYTLAVRVVSLASVMGSRGFSASAGGALGGDAQGLLKGKLRTLLETGRSGLLHVDLLERIEGALDA